MKEGDALDAQIVLPSLKISGGIREALRLGEELQEQGLPTGVLSMWNSPHPMASPVPVSMLSQHRPRAARAAFELPFLMFRFARWLHGKGAQAPTALIFTHYATLPLALLVPRNQRYFFVQGVEWNFVRNRFASAALRQIVLGVYRSGRIISANAFLSTQLAAEGLKVPFEAPIWADPVFRGRVDAPRDIDFVLMLRKGAIKRLDLNRRFIELARARGLRILAITPEDEIAESMQGSVQELLVRPSAEQMRSAYERSKCFVLLSEHEGFGLPPLEAMGSGCVPICRDSGGVQAFMNDPALAGNLLPLAMPIEQVFGHATQVIADEPAWQRLSAAARHRFDAGLREGADARRQLAAALMGPGQLQPPERP
ncbi:MAG: glycosyltransferase [Proteobacteria bacterium]|nr:glycosyltransferase [Pseudomonadota bacterium]